MQELVRSFADAVTAESIRGEQSGKYEYFDLFHVKPDRYHQQIAVFVDWQKQASERIRNGEIAEDQQKVFSAEVVQKMSEAVQGAGAWITDARESAKYIEGRWPFFDELAKATEDIRLRTHGPGSNTVLRCGEEYIQAVFQWNELLATAGVAERYERVRKSRIRLDRALSNALTSGPWDTFDRDS